MMPGSASVQEMGYFSVYSAASVTSARFVID